VFGQINRVLHVNRRLNTFTKAVQTRAKQLQKGLPVYGFFMDTDGLAAKVQ
jgi:hypothetical protein